MSHTRAQSHLERLAERLGCRVTHDQDSPWWQITHKPSGINTLVRGDRHVMEADGWTDDEVATWVEVLDACVSLHFAHTPTPERTNP